MAITRAQHDPLVDQVKFDEVLKMVREAEQQGYFFSRGMVTEGMGTISMRIPASLTTIRRPLVFGIGGRLEVLERSEKAIVEQMRGELDKLERDRRRFHEG